MVRKTTTIKSNTRLLSLFIIPIIFFVAMEVFLRLTWIPESQRYCGLYIVENGEPQPKPNAEKLVFDRWTNNSYVIKHNSLGLRNEEIGEKSMCRILILGDSFTWGTGVNSSDTYSKQLESKINAEVINAGLGGHSTIDELERLKWMINYKPDAVIVGVLPANDLITNIGQLNNKTLERYEIENPNYVTKTKEWRMIGDCIYHWDSKPLARIKNFLAYRFYSFQYIREWAMENNFAIEQAMKIGLVTHNSEFFEGDAYKKDYPKDLDKYWLVMSDTLLEMKKISEENNATFIILSLTHPDVFKYSGEGYDPFRVNKLLSTFGNENNVTVIDPSKNFIEAYANGTKLFYEIDTHPTREGHRIIADEIYKYRSVILSKCQSG